MAAMWTKFTSQLGALFGDDRHTPVKGGEAPLRPSCSLTAINHDQLRISPSRFRPSHSIEALNRIHHQPSYHPDSTSGYEYSDDHAPSMVAPFASPENISNISYVSPSKEPTTSSRSSSKTGIGKGRFGGLSLSTSQFLLRNLASFRSRSGSTKQQQKKRSVGSRISDTPTSSSSATRGDWTEAGSDGGDGNNRRARGKKSEVDFAPVTAIIPNGTAHAYDHDDCTYRETCETASTSSTASFHNAPHHAKTAALNRQNYGDGFGFVSSNQLANCDFPVVGEELPLTRSRYSPMRLLAGATSPSSNTTAGAGGGFRALFGAGRKAKRSRSVGADAHHSVQQGNTSLLTTNHSALQYVPPQRMTSSKTVCNGFSTPNPKSMAGYSCRQIDSNFLSLAQRDTPVMSSDMIFRRLEKLGEGSYATVFKSENRLDGSIVALKEIKLQPQEGLPFTAIREVSLLKGLKHANIVRLHQIVHQPHSLILVFEYVKTDLSKYMNGHRHGLDAFHTKLILYQLLRGLAYCHERKILHRDIKPQNILIGEHCEVKLADFGLARAKSVPGCRTFSHDVVTLWYRPPDVLLGSTHYTTSLDIWGVGCIMAELCTGTPLFPGANDVVDQLDKIFNVRGVPNTDEWPEVAELPNWSHFQFPPYREMRWHRVDIRLAKLHDDGDSLLTKLLQLDPDKRASAKEAMDCAYLSRNFCSSEIHHLHPLQSVAKPIQEQKSTSL